MQMLNVFKEHYLAAKEIPSYIFQNRKMTETAVSCSGQYASDFQDGYDIVLKTATGSPSAIQYANSRLQEHSEIVRAAAEHSKYMLVFEMECMKEYADDDEIVVPAPTAGGTNICYAWKPSLRVFLFATLSYTLGLSFLRAKISYAIRSDERQDSIEPLAEGLPDSSASRGIRGLPFHSSAFCGQPTSQLRAARSRLSGRGR